MKACRLCLGTDVNMTDLHGPGLKDFIEGILKRNGYYKDLNEKNNVCYECRALLIKSYKFIQRVLQGQKALYIMHPVTSRSLKSLDRSKWNLLPTLSYYRVEIDYFIDEKENKLKSFLEPNSESNEDDLMVDIKIKNEYYTVDEANNDSCVPENESKTDNSKKKQKRLPGTVITTNNIISGPRKKKIKFLMSDHESDNDDPPKKKTVKKNKKNIDDDYKPDKSSEESESSSGHVSYDDDGRRIARPKDKRVYPMQCDHCNYEIEYRAIHYKHYLYCHPNVEYPYAAEKIYMCQFCGIGKRNLSRLRDHELTHGTKKTVKCPLCPAMFHNGSRLLRHKVVHHPKRLVICDYCNKSFALKSDLRLHIRTHTGEKPFKCHICGDGFAHKGNVGIHIRSVHQNLKMKTIKKKKKQVKYDDSNSSEDSDINLELLKARRQRKRKHVTSAKNIKKKPRKSNNVTEKPTYLPANRVLENTT